MSDGFDLIGGQVFLFDKTSESSSKNICQITVLVKRKRGKHRNLAQIRHWSPNVTAEKTQIG